MQAEQEPEQPEAIAIVGMACRFPGSSTPEEYWRLLREGVESIRQLAEEELERGAIAPEELASPQYVRARALLEGVELFDARLFDLSPREAELLDPQQRLFLECAWEVLERAGHAPGRFPGLIGVYAGAGANGYLLHHLASAGYLSSSASALHASLLNKNDHLATRVAYKLDLRGPAVSVQTACSTSLVAVYHACQSLLSHQCDMALAGGVSIPLPQRVGYLYHERGIGSPDGHCRPFEERAQGTVPGAGAGVVLLRRLSEALAEGDQIHAVILGGAINNDGSLRVGYTAPSVEGQSKVIALAQAVAGVEPQSLGYVEAHGTATPVGDPIEVRALTQAFRRRTQRRGFCALGSVKGNVGHLDTAAGVAGLMKAALALQQRELPATLHFERPNPELELEQSPFYVNSRLQPWEGSAPRRAAVSAFGLGGTNAHLILEEAPERGPSGPSRPCQLLVLSARSGPALEVATARLAEHLRQHPSLPLADVACTLYTGRKALEYRRVLVCRDSSEAAAALQALAPDRVLSRTQEPVRRPLYFMLPGQGSQHPGMGAALYRSEAVFRQELERCLERLQRQHDLDLRPLLLESGPEDPDAARRLEQTAVAQPALFVTEYALARLLEAWGLRPEALIGHSVGELVAACLAGVFSLEEALDLVALRGRLMQACAPGAMLSVPRPAHEVAPLLGPELEVAADNGPVSCVVSGPVQAMEALERQLASRDMAGRRLRTSHAFHSALMESAAEAFHHAVARVRRQPPRLPFVSNLTGTWITAEQAVDPGYWARHLRHTVRFAQGLEALLREPEAALLEVGPGQALQSLARWHPHKRPGQITLSCLPGAQEQLPELEHLLRTVGQLWLAGVEAPHLFAGERRQRVLLPTYPFERRRHWVEPRASASGAAARPGSLEKRQELAAWFYVPVWKEEPPRPALRSPGKRWLVLEDGCGLGSRVAERLRQGGAEVTQVVAGPGLRRTGAGSFELAPASREDYGALLAELAAQGQAPECVAHCFGLTPEGSGASSGASSEEVLTRSFYSLLYLVQALSAHALERPVHLVAVSNGAQEVLGEDLVWPEQATVLGPCRVAPREHPRLHCRNVDVSLPGAAPALERLAAQLAAELASGAEEPVVALRRGRRWVQAFEPVRLEEDCPTQVPLREGGTCLITGGLGGLGLTFAEHLATRARARLVLVGRTGLPPREQWPRWLEEHAPEEATSRRIQAVRRLEARGAQVLVLSADVTDLERMREVVAEARRHFGALHGVLHAAGVPGGGLVRLKAREAAEQVLAPKVRGTQVLAAALEGVPLDFFVTCSSLTSVVGRLGQVDYTAANAFMDAFTRQYHARTGTHAVAVNWGAWEQVGMAARTAPQAEGAGRPLPHPLLHRCVEDTPQRRVFATTFGDSRSRWLTDEHRVVGHPTVPGVAWLELVRAALEDRAQGRVTELEDAFFLTPLLVPDGQTREVQLVLEEQGEEFWWVARSLPPAGGKPVDHAAGRARLGGPRAPRTVDLEALRSRCQRPVPDSLDTEYENDLGPRWRSVRNLLLGEGELLLSLELQEAFAAELATLRFHPSLMDRTSGMAKSFLAPRGAYLPLGYRKLRLHGDLPRRLYAHARNITAPGSDGETLTFDVVLMDEQGRVLAEVEQLTQKRVNDPAGEFRTLAATTASAWGSPEASEERPAERQEILPQEGAAALERLLTAGLAPQVVVCARDLHATQERTDEVVRERILEATSARSPQAPQERPSLEVPYVAPRTPLERQIAEAWQEVLGVSRVGIHDDFFELGGDSVQAIQIIARGSKAGLHFHPDHFFQHTTVAELARVLEGTLARQAEQGPVVGPVPLTLRQQRLLEQAAQAPECLLRTALLQLEEPVEATALGRALGALLTHHDSLRLRLTRGDSGWQQECLPPGGEVPVRQGEPGAPEAPALEPAEGCMLAAALLASPGSSGNRVLLAAHALAVDGPSWRLLLEDLGRLLHGEALPPKTASFKQWAEQVAAQAPAASALEEVARLPGPASGRLRVHQAVLPEEPTRRLQERLADTWRADLAEALLSALGRVLAPWVGGRPLAVELLSEGRRALQGLEPSRTVGCFEVASLVRLQVPGSGGAAELLRAVKEQARQASQQGRTSQVALQPEVLLNHLGSLEGLPAHAPHVLEGPAGPPPPGYRLVVESHVLGGRLHLRLGVDGLPLPPEPLAAELLAVLRSLGEPEQDAGAALTPSDFPLADLDAAEMDNLARLLGEDGG